MASKSNHNDTVASPKTEKMPENTTVKKRARRPNYTFEEKTYLAQLVSRYQYIVDDKRIGGIFIKKKREAWKAITLKYNSICTTGHRQTVHLKNLYDNMKQQARRNDGDYFTNTTTRLRLFHKPESAARRNSDASEEDAIKTLQQMKEEKEKERGSFYQPNSNVSADSASLDSTANIRNNNNRTSQSVIDPVQFLDVSLPNTHQETNGDPCVVPMEHNSWDDSQPSAVVETPGSGLLTVTPLKRCQNQNPLAADALERLYYIKKCRNANLEKKRILQETFQARQKHNLEMILLRKAFDKS